METMVSEVSEMRKRIALAVLFASAVCLLGSCGLEPIAFNGDDSDTESSQTNNAQADTDSSDIEASAAETTTEPQKHDPGFEKGVWWGVGHNDDWYYEFLSDTEGSMVYQSMGATLSFEYERNGNIVMFYIGSRDNVKRATVSDERDGQFTLSFDGGDVQILSRQEQKTLGEFQFYSTAKLIEMLRTKYRAATAKTPQRVETEIDADGNIVIRFFASENDDKPYTATLDRFTAKGKDSNGKNLDLTPYA